MLVLNREITLVLDDVSGRQTTSFNLTKISSSVTCGPCTLGTRKSLLLELLQKLQQVGRAHGSTARQVGICVAAGTSTRDHSFSRHESNCQMEKIWHLYYCSCETKNCRDLESSGESGDRRYSVPALEGTLPLK